MSVDPAATLRFAPGVKFRFDDTRQAWIVLAPERLFVPDEHAAEILKLVDGARSAAAIIDDLAARFDAPRATIETDVLEMLQDLIDRGVVRI
ncbi:MAG: pyrroloquinoline quinone biosynthesis peptide chaperone PqqD [Alphaproteobacteria bacterium]|nr:pyrroloquinoline quinone biosynthesis peptide chaperone PqqD [Alphaproteobacteria bacterium]